MNKKQMKEKVQQITRPNKFPRFQIQLVVIADASKKQMLNDEEFLNEFKNQTKDLLLSAYKTICIAGNELAKREGK